MELIKNNNGNGKWVQTLFCKTNIRKFLCENDIIKGDGQRHTYIHDTSQIMSFQLTH